MPGWTSRLADPARTVIPFDLIVFDFDGTIADSSAGRFYFAGCTWTRLPSFRLYRVPRLLVSSALYGGIHLLLM